jgi:hypothetical protein
MPAERSKALFREEKSMTYYKYSHFLMYEDGPEYEATCQGGAAAPFSGIYYCEGCGRSITSGRSQLLPSQDHHLHAAEQGPVRWRLAVKSYY